MNKDCEKDLRIIEQLKLHNIGDDELDMLKLWYPYALKILRHQVPCDDEKEFEIVRKSVLGMQILLADKRFSEEFGVTISREVIEMAKNAKFIQATTTTNQDEELTL